MAAIALTGASAGGSTASGTIRLAQTLRGVADGGCTARASISVNGVLVVATDDRSWWPPGYGEDPAFQVRRQVYSTVVGGDYVRGSATPSGLVPTTPGQLQLQTLPHTALRYPTAIPGAAEAVGRAVLHVRPTARRDLPRTIVQNIHNEDGSIVGQRNIPVGAVEITWGWPSSIEDTWQEVALVRSAFGRPSTVNDGQTVMIGARTSPVWYRNGELLTPPIVEDRLLPPGRWYHYGLFFKISEVEWIQGMLDSCLVPRNFGHDQHLYENVPPYYRWMDENSMVGDGFLKQFLNVFGYELDQTREFVESWQHVYDADWSPIRLLRKLGDNFGYPYEQGIGDIRYRSLFTELGRFYEIRGTRQCLEGVVKRMSKYDCTVEGGANQMLLPDDSDFYTGVGNWASAHPSTDGPGTTLSADRVLLDSVPASTLMPPVGRASMMMTTSKADETAKVALACGDGFVGKISNLKEVQPLQGGVPVQEETSYGFSVWVQIGVPTTNVQLSLLWFDGTGLATGMIAASSGALTPIANTNWTQMDIGTITVPPAGAVYVVPYILFDLRPAGVLPLTSQPIYIAGAMLYTAESIGEAVGPPPNQYLTISDPGEPLGSLLNFKGTLTGAGTALPSVHATYDAYVLTPAPIPTAAPNFTGVTPSRVAALNDSIYWNGTAWINVGPIPSTFKPFLLGAPS